MLAVISEILRRSSSDWNDAAPGEAASVRGGVAAAAAGGLNLGMYPAASYKSRTLWFFSSSPGKRRSIFSSVSSSLRSKLILVVHLPFYQEVFQGFGFFRRGRRSWPETCARKKGVACARGYSCTKSGQCVLPDSPTDRSGPRRTGRRPECVPACLLPCDSSRSAR